MGFDVEEYIKSKKQKNSTSSEQKTQSFDVEAYVKSKNIDSVAENLTNRFNSWLESSSNYAWNYKNKTRGKSFDYTDSYVSDSADWLSEITKQKSALDAEREWIASTINSYSDFFDAEWRENALKALEEGSSANDSVFKAAEEYNKYWTSFESEDAFNKWASYERERQKKLTTNLDDLKVSVADLESKYEYSKKLEDELNQVELSLKYASHGGIDIGKAKQRKEELLSLINEAGSASVWFEQLSSKRAFYLEAEYMQGKASLEDVTSKPDFEKYVQIGADASNPDWISAHAPLDIGGWTPFGDGKDIGNMVTFAESNADEVLKVAGQALRGGGKQSELVTMVDLINQYMRDDEKKIYNYYVGKGDTKSAEAYLKYLTPDLEQRKAAGVREDIDGNLFLSTIVALSAGIDQSVTGFENLGNVIFNGGEEEYTPPTYSQMLSAGVREDVAEKSGVVGTTIFDLAQTTGNMLPSILTSTIVGAIPGLQGAAPVIGTAMMGGSAAGNAYTEMINLGYSDGQAKAYAAMTGASEALLSYALGGISKLGGKLSGKTITAIASGVDNAIGRIAIKMGGNMLSEFTEEGLQEVLTPFFENLATGTNINSLDDINWGDVAYSGLLGALSAGFLETGGTISSDIATTKSGKEFMKTGKDAGQNLANFAKNTFSADTVAYKIANKVNENTGAYTIGTLLQEANATLSEQNLSEIENGLIERGLAKSDAKKLARQYQAFLNGEMSFSDEQIKVLENTEPLSDILRKNIIGANTTVYQRTRDFNDVVNPTKESESKAGTAPYSKEFIDSLEYSAEQNGLSVGNRALRDLAREKFSVSESDNTTANKFVSEGKFKASEDGKTIVTETSEEVTPVKIVSTEGDLKVELKGGKVVEASKLSFSTDSEAIAYEMVAKMGVSVDTANALVNAFKTVDNGQMVMGDVPLAYQYGKIGYKEGLANVDLTDTQKQYVYDLGRADAEIETKAEQEKVTTNVKTRKGSGQVRFEKGAKAKSPAQKKAVNLATHLAKAIGIDIVFYDATIEGTYGSDSNGYFDERTNTIHLDLQNSNDDAKTIAFTMSHELVHFIKKWSPAKFKVFADFLMEQYMADSNTSNLLQKKMDALGTTDIDLAYEELIADACETMLLDSNAVVKLMELRKSDLDLFEKIKLHILQLLNKIRAEYKRLGLAPTSDEAKALLKMEDVLSKLHEMFEEAAVDATQNYQAAESLDMKIVKERGYTPSDEKIANDDGIKKQVKKNKENFVEDKYFKSQMQRWDSLSLGSYVKVGEILEDHPLVKVGMPQGIIRYDVAKLNKNMEKHKFLNIDLLHAIPDIIANPIAISEYSQANTVNVFGDVFVGDSPMMVAVTISKDRSGADISKVRTYNARRDVGTLITDDTVLYLNEDKKRTRKWFQANGKPVPLGETKFGFIRSISQNVPNVKKQLKKSSYAPTFYSHMGKVIDDIKLEKMGAGGVVSYLKGKGVKNEEIKWSGIEAFLEGKKSVTKAELQEFVAGSQLTIEEEMPHVDNKAYVMLDDLWQEYFGNPLEDTFDEQLDITLSKETMKEAIEEKVRQGYDKPPRPVRDRMVRLAGIIGQPTRWDQYKLDGGTNYRELMFKLPNSSYSNRAMKGHWGEDAEGVLVHARIQDFEVDGKKMLFVEEIQSDWHNEGHKKGYSTEEYEETVAIYDKLAEDYANKRKAFNQYVRSSEFRSDPDEVSKKKFDWLRGKMETAEKRMQDAERDVEALKAKGMGDVPDAPLRDTYHEYVMKRLLRMAAEEGYDSIGWTIADMQSDRWSDEFAEGYRIEYDQEIPKFLRKYGKKWGATVGKEVLPGLKVKETLYDVNREIKFDSEKEWKKEVKEWLRDGGFSAREANATEFIREGDFLVAYDCDGNECDRAKIATIDNKVWTMDITDSMKDSVLYEGQPKFQKKMPTNRTLLANALDSIAQNDIEKNKLTQYKKKIALIEAEQAKLSAVRQEANDIRFKKGRTPDETKRMKDLDFEANQTANRINTYDRQLLNLESTEALKNVLTREKELARKKEAQKGKEALAAYKERAANTQRELMTRYQESRKNAIEGRHKTEMKHKIKKVVSDLNNLLLNPTKDQHVPIGLQFVVADALDAINMDTMNAGERVAYYNDLIAKSSDSDEIATLTKKRDFFEYRDASFQSRITALKNAYAEFKESDDPLIRSAHDDAIENLIRNTADEVGNKSLKNMSLDQLEAVYDMYKAILSTVRNSNKMFKEGRQATVTENSEAVKTEVREVGGHKDRVLKLAKFFKSFGWTMLKPVTAMKVIGSDTFAKLFDNVRAGEDTWAVDVNEAKQFFDDTADKYGYKSWNFKKKFSFMDSAGHSFSLTLEQIMSLYAYSKREQADQHLEFGGFIFDDAIEITEKNKLGIPLKYEVNDANPYRLRKEDLLTVTNALDEKQKGFIDEMQTYLSDVMGAKGNEVSLALYDIKLYKEKNYFPLKTSRYFREFDPEKAGTPKIKNSGFSKKTVPQAGNPIVLSNFMDVWAGHVNDMSMYHAFVLPLEDFMRVYNYSSTAGGYDSVQQYIKNAYGSQANQYIERLVDDLNGGARVDSSAGVINKGLSLFKKASVFASASVVIQQPSAIARALAYINPKYFATSAPSAVNFANHKKLWEEVKKYAPVAVIKEMGYFDTGMGKSTVEWIKGDQTIKDKVDDFLSKAPAMADELSWTYIWEAVKKETADKSGLAVGSEEFLKKAGERFTEVITNTQVYDSVLSRSQAMRSKDTGMKMATAFMAEPLTTVNMMVDGILQGKRGNKKFTAATVGAVSASIILNSILVSIVYGARDDDEDETYAEKYVGSLTTELVDGFNPLTYIPFVKDIWSIAQGFDVERSDMSVISKLWESVEGLFNENKSGLDKVLDVSGSLASLFGIPLKNLIRDGKAMYNVTKTIMSGTPTTKAGLAKSAGDALRDSVPLLGRFSKEKSDSDLLYEAILDGDAKQIERVKKRFKDQKAIDSALRKALRDYDPRIKDAAKARMVGDIAEYKRIAEEIIAEGNFSQDVVVGAINAEISALDKEKPTVEEPPAPDKETSIYKADDINLALASGDLELAKEIINDLLDTKVANGMEEDKAKSSVKSSITSYWKPLYKEAYKKGDTEEMKRIREILRDTELYGRPSEILETCKRWLKDSE